ncbi:hypothetical protein [Leclercia adecarboxylata]|nr:hypothetical protein [Leclercia adecarboxylata]
MAKQYDFKTVFKLLDEMEACLNKVRQLNAELDASQASVAKAA